MFELMYEPHMEPPEEQPVKCCPVCGNDVWFDTKIYKRIGGEILGCERCIDAFNAEEILE